jgi:hypothetical protein
MNLKQEADDEKGLSGGLRARSKGCRRLRRKLPEDYGVFILKKEALTRHNSPGPIQLVIR